MSLQNTCLFFKLVAVESECSLSSDFSLLSYSTLKAMDFRKVENEYGNKVANSVAAARDVTFTTSEGIEVGVPELTGLSHSHSLVTSTEECNLDIVDKS